jgi:hypothetical protein
MGKLKKIFRRVGDPRAANARHDLLEVLVTALAAVLAERRPARTWRSSGWPRKSCCSCFCACNKVFPVTTRSAACSVCSSRKPSRRHSGASWRLMPRPTGSISPGWSQSTAKRCEAPSRVIRVTSLCTWSTSGRWRRECVLPSRRLRNETKGALEVLALLSLEGCIVTADALHCNRAMAKTVLDRGGDYVLAIKANRGPLFKAWSGSLLGLASAGRPRRSSRPPTTVAKRAGQPSCAIPAWLPSTASRAWLRLAASPRADSCRAIEPSRRSCAIICSPSRCPPSGFCRSCAVIGPSRTNCVGYSTSTSTRTATDREWTMLPRTSPFWAGSRSTSFDLVPVPPPYVEKSNAPAGTTASSYPCSAIRDSPAACGDRSDRIEDAIRVRGYRSMN